MPLKRTINNMYCASSAPPSQPNPQKRPTHQCISCNSGSVTSPTEEIPSLKSCRLQQKGTYQNGPLSQLKRHGTSGHLPSRHTVTDEPRQRSYPPLQKSGFNSAVGIRIIMKTRVSTVFYHISRPILYEGTGPPRGYEQTVYGTLHEILVVCTW